MIRARLLGFWVGLVFAVSASASAQIAYATKPANVRAGPGREYPRVAQIPPGAPVEINGCVDDWTWCDVSFGPDRGWVWAGNLEYPYQNRRVLIISGGPIFGLPIVGFEVGPYWDRYYRGRPWYRRRSYWIGRPPPPHGPPGYRPPGSRPPAGRPPVVRPRPPVVQPRPGPRREVVRPAPRPPRPARPPAPKRPDRDH